MRSGEMPEGSDRLAASRYLIGEVWRLTERGWFVAKPDFDADLVGPNWILADSQTAMPGPVGEAERPRNVEIGLGLALTLWTSGGPVNAIREDRRVRLVHPG